MRTVDTAFENEVLTGQRWEALKPSTPWGQVPVLEVDGQLIAQTPAIMNYVGRLTKLLPADAVQGAKVEEFCATIEDCANAAVAPSFGKSGQVNHPTQTTGHRHPSALTRRVTRPSHPPGQA